MFNQLLLIVLPNAPFHEVINKKKKQFSIKLRKEVPLGALSIAAYEKKYFSDLSVQIIDLNIVLSDLLESKGNLAETDLSGILEDTLLVPEFSGSSLLIGLSAIFNTSFSYLEPVARICRMLYPRSFIFSGGGLPSNLYDEVLRNAGDMDAVCIGEGEIPVRELLESVNLTEYLAESSCWVTKEKLGGHFTKEFKFIEDLDEIPPLDFNLINYRKYSYHIHTQEEKAVVAAPLMFSRGCPFNCCFCASHSIHGKKVRYNSLERIKSDVLGMVNEYQVNTIAVWDDNFFVDKGQAIELLDFFTKLNLKMEFVNGFPVYRMDDDMALKLKQAGIEAVTLAVESGNPRVLKDIIHKPLRIEMATKAVECIRRHDMYVKGLFVIGLPGETLEDIEVTMDFIHKTPFNWVDIYIASPVAGSELYDICREKGYLRSGDLGEYNFWEGSIETPEFRPEQIQEIQLINVLRKDFVDNYDMLHENYKRALINFEHVINTNPDNPFAYYYAALASKNLLYNDKSLKYYDSLKKIISKNPQWKYYFDMFSVNLSGINY